MDEDQNERLKRAVELLRELRENPDTMAYIEREILSVDELQQWAEQNGHVFTTHEWIEALRLDLRFRLAFAHRR